MAPTTRAGPLRPVRYLAVGLTAPRAVRLVGFRLLQAVPVLLIVAIGVFALVQLAPGDAVDAYLASSGGGGLEFAARLRTDWGLSVAWPARLAAFLWQLASFDLGHSVAFDAPVLELVGERILNTLLLTVSAMALAVGLGCAAGVATGLRPGSARDVMIGIVLLVLNAMPGFFLGVVLLLVFALKLAWFPLSGVVSIRGSYTGLAHVGDVAWHLVLPVCTLGLTYAALYQRLMRAGIVRAAASDYMRTARAKGLSARRIVWRHMVRNALLPVVTMLAVQSSLLLGGSVVVETVFAIPGLGRLAYEAVSQRDLNLLVGIILSGTLVVIAANLFTDLLASRLDPRIRV